MKRIVKNCVTLAEREVGFVPESCSPSPHNDSSSYLKCIHSQVELLRETDQHPNVIRYFCMVGAQSCVCVCVCVCVFVYVVCM